MRRLSSVIFLTAITVVSMVLPSGTAVAGPLAWASVYSVGGGARSDFQDVGEHLYSCDFSANGLRSVAIAEWTGSAGVPHRVAVEDVDGANGNCAGYADLTINDGISVKISACEKNGASGSLQNCNAIFTNS